jgi:AbiTii-like protein
MSLVLELQREIYENKIHTQDILRKAYIISRKLNINNISEWLNFEMNGYEDKDVPEYREIKGIVYGRNPFKGWEAIIIEDPTLKNNITNLKVNQSLQELESTVNSSDGDTLRWTRDGLEVLAIHFQMEVILKTTKSQIENIFGIVKNKILEWTLDLEENGILGENMTFTKEEKSNASNITYNFNGDNARINNNSTDNSTNIIYNNPEVIKQLNALRDEINKLENNSKESLEIIETIEDQLKSKQPNKTIVKSLLGALPQIANIMTIGTAILSFL